MKTTPLLQLLAAQRQQAIQAFLSAQQLGIEVRPTVDGKGFFFVDEHGNYSDVALNTEEAAWDLVLADIELDAPLVIESLDQYAFEASIGLGEILVQPEDISFLREPGRLELRCDSTAFILTVPEHAEQSLHNLLKHRYRWSVKALYQALTKRSSCDDGAECIINGLPVVCRHLRWANAAA